MSTTETTVPLITIEGSRPVRRGTATCRWVGSLTQRYGNWVVDALDASGNRTVVKAALGSAQAQRLLDTINSQQEVPP